MGALRTAAARLVLVGASLAFGLGVAEGVARWLPLWPDVLSGPDPLLGFAHIPGARGRWVNIEAPLEFSAAVAINAHGLHDREIDLARRRGTARVLMLGDSLVEGLEVGREHTAAKQLERVCAGAGRAVEVVNAAHYGYGTDQELLYYRHRGRWFRPDLVLVGFTDGNDVLDNLAHETLFAKPYFELGPRGLVLFDSHVRAALEPRPPPATLRDRFWTMLHERSKLYRFLDHRFRARPAALPGLTPGSTAAPPAAAPPGETRGWELTRALLRELKQDVEADGARFAVVMMPERALTPRWSAQLGQLAREAGFSLIDPLPDFRAERTRAPDVPLHFPRDGHLTAAGHALLARRLALELPGLLPVPR